MPIDHRGSAELSRAERGVAERVQPVEVTADVTAAIPLCLNCQYDIEHEHGEPDANCTGCKHLRQVYAMGTMFAARVVQSVAAERDRLRAQLEALTGPEPLAVATLAWLNAAAADGIVFFDRAALVKRHIKAALEAARAATSTPNTREG